MLVPGDTDGLGFEISLSRFSNSPSKVPRGLMHHGCDVSLSRIGLILGDLKGVNFCWISFTPK